MSWWQPREIIFSQPQVMWLIENLDGITYGVWPPYPDETGYTDSTRVQISPSRHAPFERPCQIAAELNYRIRRTGTDGKLLVRQVQHEELILEAESRCALAYVSGYKRKRMRYKDWKRQYQYRELNQRR